MTYNVFDGCYTLLNQPFEMCVAAVLVVRKIVASIVDM